MVVARPANTYFLGKKTEPAIQLRLFCIDLLPKFSTPRILFALIIKIIEEFYNRL
jgi:hypothetical protein